MKNQRYRYPLILIIFLFTIILASCGSDDSSSGGSKVNNPPPVAGNDPVTEEKTAEIVFTEIMYNPADDSPEFIELVHIGDEAVDISGYTFSRGIDYKFKDGTILEPGEIIVLSDVDPDDDSSLADRIPENVRLFAPYDGKLDDGGEEIELRDRAGNKVCDITYRDESPWPVSADGFGYSMVVVDQTLATWGNFAQDWFASAQIGGSPGTLDATEVMSNLGVRINEVLSHTDTPGGDAIELFNNSADEVDISGWYLTDNKNDLSDAYQIPNETVIEPNGYLVLYETPDQTDSEYTFGDDFQLSAHGEQIFLFGADRGIRNGYAHGFSFGEVENNITFGRYVNASGQIQFVAQKEKTLGAENAGPYVSDIVISEIMYHADGDIAPCNFVEITNTNPNELILFDYDHPKNRWKINGIDFTFPDTVTIKNNERIVLIEQGQLSVAEFRSYYELPNDIRIFTYDGTLKANRETLEVLKPEDPIDEDDDVPPYMVMDRAGYDEDNPGLEAADGSGVSLERIDLEKYGDDYTNWKLSEPGGTPGF